MKKIRKLAGCLSLMLMLSSASALADTPKDSSSKVDLPTHLGFFVEHSGTFLEDPYSNGFRDIGDYLVRRRYVKLSEDSFGSYDKKVSLANLKPGEVVTLDESVSIKKKITRDDLEVTGSLSQLTEEEEAIVMNELIDVAGEHFNWSITGDILEGTVLPYTHGPGNRLGISYGFKQVTYRVVVDIVPVKETMTKPKRWDFSKMKIGCGELTVPNPTIIFNHYMGPDPVDAEDDTSTRNTETSEEVK